MMITKEKVIFEINGTDAKKLKRFERQHKDCPMGQEQSFEIVYAYAVGVARYGDPRISKSILYKVSLDAARNQIMNYTGTDEENLAKFFERFKRVVLEEMDKYHSDNERLREKCLS